MWYGIDHKFEKTEDYPYTGVTGECNYDESKGEVWVRELQPVQQNEHTHKQIMAALKGGPLAASIRADELVFRNYTGGIISRDSCGTDVNFAVLLVGYSINQEGQIDYLRVKNSWGTDWGEDGFARLEFTGGLLNPDKGTCGINQWLSKAITDF